MVGRGVNYVDFARLEVQKAITYNYRGMRLHQK